MTTVYRIDQLVSVINYFRRGNFGFDFFNLNLHKITTHNHVLCITSRETLYTYIQGVFSLPKPSTKYEPFVSMLKYSTLHFKGAYDDAVEALRQDSGSIPCGVIGIFH